MKKNNLKNRTLSRLITIALLSSLAISNMFLMTSCNKNQNGDNSSNSSSSSSSDQSSQASTSSDDSITNEDAKKLVQSNPAALSEADKVVSLQGYGSKGALADQNLTIASMLIYAIQDEYAAHGEYVAISDKFGKQNPYTNIIPSEETHINLLTELFKSYGMTVTEDTSSEHVDVPNSLLEAAQTGVQAEIDNIAMYNKFLEKDLPQSVKDVFTTLRNASEKHLKAFNNQVSKLK